jgi:two-component system, chemotaxis family, sensor kinase CheA
MGDMDDIVKDFLVESNENLDQLDRDLVTLEKDPTAREVLASIFRTIHTIKGTSGFLGFTRLGSVTHVGENLLSSLRDGRLLLNSEITSALLALVDAVRQILVNIENNGKEGEGDYTALIETLTRLQGSNKKQKPAPHPGAVTPSAPPVAAAPPPVDPLNAEIQSSRSPSEKTPAKCESPEAPAATLPLGEMLVQAGQTNPDQVQEALSLQHDGDPRRLGEILVEAGAARPAAVQEALQGQAEARASSLSESNIRVDVGLLDKLMNLVGELVLARNQILQFSSTQQDSTFLNTTQRLNLITTELQEGVMKTRMQPIGNIWSKFPRVVRDLATGCGKQIRLEMEGKETELDKTLIEAIKDPLTHVVRNSVDHGVESPEKRLAAGKPAEGRLFLRAFHEGGQVNIEISDDGAGIDVERVKQKALSKSLITLDQATRMNDRELLNLIFLPGLSTAEKVTNVSGRGVGMDVVKTNIEKIGGTVDIHSRPGCGTTLKIKIPLTLAIIPALIVTSGGDRYAIPQVSLLELVRLEGEQARKGIEKIHGASVYRLRGKLLPLVNLNHELRVDEGENSSRRDALVNIVVLQADDRHFGLVVDDINDTEEIVVKPLGKQLKGIPTFAGATIMGDGQVALILDVLGLAQRANVISEIRDRSVGDKTAEAGIRHDDGESLLLLRGPDDGRMAMPLSLVARLEEFARSAIENAGGRHVVQYRGQILPLIHLSAALSERRQEPRNADPATPADADEKIQVVVYADQGRSVGLVVDRILDIAHEAVKVRKHSGRHGTLGTMVVQGRVTEMLDLKGIITTADPTFFQEVEAA